MRYLVCGDIHGNLPALEKLLQVEKGNYDLLICHGDLVNYAPWGNECVQLMDSLSNAKVLLGNHEENYLQGEYGGTHPVARAFFDFCYPKFTELELIRYYGIQEELKDFVVKHTVLNKYIFEDTDLQEVQLDSNYIIGHSHYQFTKEINGRELVNTGSLGQNRKFINIAEYVIYDDVKKVIDLKSFEVDIDVVINQMRENNYPPICVEYYMNKERKK